MKIPYREIITNIELEIDTTKTRKEFAEAAAEKYIKETGKTKRSKPRAVEYFETDSGSYHRVRDILEDIDTSDFNEVANVFRREYPQASAGWKYALNCGIVVKAGKTVGNYSNGQLIYNCELSRKIREAGINGNIEAIVFNH